MQPLLRFSLYVVMLVSLLACGGGGTPGEGDPPLTAPTWRVTGPCLTSAQFDVLALALGLPRQALQQQGFVTYTDLDRFAHVPTVPLANVQQQDEEGTFVDTVALDFDAIDALTVPDESESADSVANALAAADLLEVGKTPYQVLPVIEHSRLLVTDLAGNESVTPIDTQVAHDISLEGVPVIGPGAKVRVLFAPDGKVSQALYTLRPVARGDDVPIRTATDAIQEGMQALQPLLDQGGSGLVLKARLVYYAPPAELATVDTILPYYELDGSFVPASSADRVPVRTLLLPATQTALVPTVTLQTSYNGQDVAADVSIQGGKPPYTIGWTSTTGQVGSETEGQVSIDYLLGTSPLVGTNEFVGVTVTDANGVTVTATGLAAAVPTGLPLPWGDEVAVEHGSEWVGTSQGLSGSARNASRFVTKLEEVSLGRFNRGDLQTAERRFRDITLAGADNLQGSIDSVDIGFYTGHANGFGWTFPTPFDDDFLSYADARYGDGDLEWLVIAACGPLQEREGTPTQGINRWLDSFQGLHLLCGYANVSKDNTREGLLLATKLAAGWTVRQAWLQTAVEVQGRRQVAGVLGVYGFDGRANFDDHLHGRGSVGPDIRDPRGMWVVYMNCR